MPNSADVTSCQSTSVSWEKEFVCRGKEGGNLLHYDHPRGAGLHLIRLFVTGVPPNAPALTLQDVIDWDSQPRHSYIADGTGGISIAAHPSYRQKETIRSLRGLIGMELAHCGDCGFIDRLWDELLRERIASGEPMLWGFGGDDMHLTLEGHCGLSWVGVKIRRRNTAELKRSMRNGAVYPSNGVVIRDFCVDNAKITVSCERPAEVRWMASGQYYDALGLEVRHRYPEDRELPSMNEARRLFHPDVGFGPGANRCLAVEYGVKESSFAVNLEIAARTPYVRCVVIDSEDIEEMRQMFDSGRSLEEIKAAEKTIRKAFSMPFAIGREGQVESPYPDEGEWIQAMTHNHADLHADRVEKAVDYHAAYRRLGIEASFETGYCYWFFPYLYYPEGATPVIRSVKPDRFQHRSGGIITINGDYFPEEASIFVGNMELPVFKSQGGKRLIVRIPDGLAPGIFDVTVRDNSTLYQDTRADAFILQTEGSNNEGWTRFGVDEGLPDECVYFVRRAGGILYAGTRNGLAILDGERFVPAGGGPVNAESAALEPDGRLWVSGWDGVYSREQDGSWRRWGEEDGLLGWRKSQASFHQILRTASGEILLTHYRPGRVSVFDGKRWREELTLTGGRHNAVTFLAESPDGRIFSGSQGYGILERCRDGWRRSESVPQPPARSPRRIYFDPSGRMVLACAENTAELPGGVQVFDDGRWIVIDRSTGLPDNRVWALAFKEGAMWAATNRGLAQVDAGGKITVYNMMDSGLPHDVLTDVFIDDYGCVWMASGRGVARFRIMASDSSRQK